MSVFPIGDQRVGIVTEVPVLDGNGDPVFSEYMEPETTEHVDLVDGCCIEVQTMTEQQGVSTTTSHVAVMLLPEVDGRVPLVDDDGEPAGFKPVSEITSNALLRDIDLSLTYVMRSPAVLQRGPVSHVECMCEREEP